MLLRTTCGCERLTEVDDHAAEWNVPMLRESSMRLDAPADSTDPVKITARRFRWMGNVENGVEVWQECEERNAEIPGPPQHLTTGEWADCVARFAAGVGGDIHDREHEFMDRHRPAAHFLMHKNGTLIAAYYPGPLWSHSEGAVSVFNEFMRRRRNDPD